MMKSERTRPEVLEAHYGSAAPVKPLQALQRDALLASSKTATEDVYEVPMAEVREERETSLKCNSTHSSEHNSTHPRHHIKIC